MVKCNMKKPLLIVLLLCTITALGWLAVFSWNNLRGIRPALKNPPRGHCPAYRKCKGRCQYNRYAPHTLAGVLHIYFCKRPGESACNDT